MNNNDIQKLMSAFEKMDNGNNNKESKAKVEQMLGNLNDKQSEKIKQVLSDPEKTKEILNSPAAKALMKKLMNNG
ncbi:MAG: hypothetical protein PUD53_00935 [Oscillospiraceae bacterium]|nr:hypothetical protein [Oscillospiraceae bacterium]